ncbi:MAG TPA: DNA repair protein RadA [Marinilabiliales bacterium]|nr:MAG: DNA repair protein RadA [Bacteroidetes bacterium GWC2_40_13]OFX73214.1 MAG: DNA repair protein RadA [Bacteroidetes bacterium GWD2_40_43]OFX92069.1 MAG: DNA repair protein RadA [Bacteroidetes bacterium GWE2_40_63]OFY16693.1 MAG: DNA repair protein RadA [Bacteroidetes bacterium GWF2_40_13]OFZ30589.1 MAG: DNA repair protein RadA [Bacteroidetes bacterium RIFOXYC2_FULL_40_12]HAM98910.1 DNA repair protein RadA [Marinilabiliales bacterium]
MAKAKTVYVCQSCGANSPKWIGRCPSCNEWNTYSEEVIIASAKSPALTSNYATGNTPILLNDIKEHGQKRIPTTCREFDRVLGGGLVPGSVILIGGEPGIGKSTLLLQIAQNFQGKILYVSGEESAEQIKMRANRLGYTQNNVYFLAEILTEAILIQSKQLLPDLIIIDSIQTLRTEFLDSSPGTVTQIRESATQLLHFAKENQIPVVLVGHITKDGSLAGPKILEHVVDTVLQFEGDNHFMYRILRSSKNRFGSTSEIGIFEMIQSGLREVANPSEFLLSEHHENYSGISTCATIEGVRPFLIEVQALVSSAVYGTPQRTSTGFDTKRLNLLLAVLEKRIGFRLSSKDVFLNIAGGLKVADTAIDLAVICAILSSDVDRPIPKGTCFAGEVGLSGEIRPTGRLEQRIAEASKLGYKRIFVPQQKNSTSKTFGIEVVGVQKVEQVFAKLFN